MPWGPGGSVTSGSISTNIDRLFIFGTTDASKDLVSGTTYSKTLYGGAAYGSDAIGTYVESFANGDVLKIGSLGQVVSDTDYSWFLTFSRTGTIGNFSPLFNQIDSTGTYFHGVQCTSPPTSTRVYSLSPFATVANNLSTITTNTEFTVVITKTGATGKYFFTGGSAPISFTANTFTGTRTLTFMDVCGWTSGSLSYFGRFRAYGKWLRTLSDVEAQSMADNPQQIVTYASSTVYDFQSLNRGVGRGIARGIA